MKKTGPIIIFLLATQMLASAQTTTTRPSKDSATIIIEQVNQTFCSIITLATVITAGITALVIIAAGIRYMSSEDPQEAGQAKTMIIYAFAGMTIVLAACPIIEYLVTGTNIIPFENSCPCLVGGQDPTVTTTLDLRCSDETRVGECSTKTVIGTNGARCVSNAGNPTLIPDTACPVPTTTTTHATTTFPTSSTAASSTTQQSTTTIHATTTTTMIILCATANCPDPAASCQAAYELSRCKDGAGFDGLDTICGEGYRACCCDNYLNSYSGTALYTVCCS